MTQPDFVALETSAVAEGFQRWIQRAQLNPLAGSCCQNGSQVQPTQQQKIWITGAALCAALGVVWTPLAGAICEVLVPFLLDLGPICSQCPPAPVAPVWSTVWANGVLPGTKEFIDWVVATFISQNWNTFCQCIGGTGCGGTQVSDALNGSGSADIYGTTLYPLVGDPTTLTFNYTFTADTTVPTYHPVIQFLNASNGNVIEVTMFTATTSPTTGTFTTANLHGYMSSGATKFRMELLVTPNPGGVAFHTQISGPVTYSGCSAPINPYIPPTVIPPPGDIPAPPPLPTGCTTDQICQKVTYIEQELDNIARFLWNTVLPPHSWAEGASHTGLTGNGSLPLFANTRAIKAIVTTLPNRAGSIIGSPSRIFDVGWLTAAGSEGPYQTWTLDFASQVFTLPPVSNLLYYSIPPDVLVTVIELIAGP